MISTFKFSNVCLHITLISILIIVIFFTYGLKLEKYVVEKQIEYVIDNNLGILKLLFPNKKIFDNDQLESLKIKDDPETIRKIDENNRGLMKNGIIFNIILFVITLFIIAFMIFKFGHKEENGKDMPYSTYFLKLVLYNIISLIFIGITYIYFARYIGHNYIYIDANKISIDFLNKLETITSESTSTPISMEDITEIINLGIKKV